MELRPRRRSEVCPRTTRRVSPPVEHLEGVVSGNDATLLLEMTLCETLPERLWCVQHFSTSTSAYAWIEMSVRSMTSAGLASTQRL